VEKPANLSSERVLYVYLASVPNVVLKPSLGDSLEYMLNQMLSKSVLPQLETMPLTKILNLQSSGEPSGKVVTIPNHATSTSWKCHKCLWKKKTHLVQIVTDFD
jgi:hypothetical protein